VELDAFHRRTGIASAAARLADPTDRRPHLPVLLTEYAIP
jgi:hypothetical protein